MNVLIVIGLHSMLILFCFCHDFFDIDLLLIFIPFFLYKVLYSLSIFNLSNDCNVFLLNLNDFLFLFN